MIVVSDTSPLNYLLLIDAIDVLPALFQEVYVPEAVAAELRSADAPEVVRNWISAPPPWLLIRTAGKMDLTLRLGRGESEAISLAQEFGADHVLIDEWAGRHAAQQRGLHVVGTLGVLIQGAERNLFDLRIMFEKLSKTTFRADQRLFDQLLKDLARDDADGKRGPIRTWGVLMRGRRRFRVFRKDTLKRELRGHLLPVAGGV